MMPRRCPKVEVLVGMIASGKSTYARKRADEGALVVCHDDLTAMLHAHYRYEFELRDVYRQMEEDLVRRGLRRGRDVVIDRTHLTRESRQRWVDVYKRVRNEFLQENIYDQRQLLGLVAVYFPPLSAAAHAYGRFYAGPRGRTLAQWTEVATHHLAQAEAEPLDWAAEGFSGIVEVPSWPSLEAYGRAGREGVTP